MASRSLREHIENLEEKGLLFRVKREINKDTELHPLVRWQFRGGLAEEERRAFLFENVVDAEGKRYDIPVVVGAYAASNYIYAVGLGCEPEAIVSVWNHAIANPIEPVLVPDGPAQEVVYLGDESEVGMDRFPVPISTPGFDNAPYTTCSNWFTKDPETGTRNVGNYRGMVKDRDRIGMAMMISAQRAQDAAVHWHMCKERGIPLEAALVIGTPPAVAYCAVTKLPYDVDEIAVAGGLCGTPIPLVKCKTVDIEVPAEAELVIEGKVPTEYLENEGPFGESHGHMDPRAIQPYLEITAITHRRNPIYVSWISQVTPSESSVIKRRAYEATFCEYLRVERRIRSVTRVMMHEPLTNLRKVVIIQMKNPLQEEVWRGLYAAITYHPGVGKIVIAVDEDIDPENLDAVFWAMAYRMKPADDVAIVPNRSKGHGPPFELSGRKILEPIDSAMLINATLKEPFPPVALPKKPYMDRAREIWEELGLPKLKPQSPWFGYSLGLWSEELDEEANLAVQGKHYITGGKFVESRVKS